jgi:hypothetical protein
MSNENLSANGRQWLIPDESTLSKLVVAGLKLPMSQSLLAQNFKISVIEQCWKNQLRLKSRLKIKTTFDL